MEKKSPRYSRALLETLALVAYRQPISRGEIEEIRGVTVSSDIIKKLLDREWIKVDGYRDVPGKPALYVTTKAFLDYFNLREITELPPLEGVVQLKKSTLN
nr:SMC-Scp complex subunit ScpB [Coxiella-like endosymbiont]